MIPLSVPVTKTGNWQQQLAEGFRTPAELLEHLDLAGILDPGMESAANSFPLRVTRYYAQLMKKGDPLDPLLLQVLPTTRELAPVPGFGTDPTGDLEARSGPGLLQKYHGRALILATGSCAINCRYCFRRHYPYAQQGAHPGQWDPVIAELRKDQSLSEVILSGGDPLMLSNARLAELVTDLEQLPHIRRLRIHSRLPVALPDRIDEGLISILAHSSLASVLVIHANHPNELTTELGAALAPLQRAGVALLNQSVLLRQINDDPETLTTLSELLFDFSVLPYYLHQLDKVEGAAHFEVAEQRALWIHEQMRRLLPGYLLPRLVRENPGATSKQPLQQDIVLQ